MEKLNLEEIDEKTEFLDFELEGKVFMIQKDKDGNVLLRQEMDGDVLLKILLDMFSDAAENYIPPEILDGSI